MRSWKGGPDARTTGPVVLSYTEYTAARYRDLPAIIVIGTRLRRFLCGMEDAVGSWFHADLRRRQVGSLSVWKTEAGLRRFITSPPHIPVMRKYRHRGTLRAVTWHADRYVPDEAFAEGLRRIAEARPRGHEPDPAQTNRDPAW